MNMGQEAAFGGAKCALFLGQSLVIILRDDFAGLPFASHWDFPGGGREAYETPLMCAQRECREELSISFVSQDVLWQRPFDTNGLRNWFFVARLPYDVIGGIALGSEGQRWTMMAPRTYLAHPRGIPVLQQRLGMYLNGVS